MEIFLVATPWDVISSLLVFLCGLAVTLRIGRRLKLPIRRATLLYVWHTLFCYVYADYVQKNLGDAVYYYLSSLHGTIDFKLGTESIRYLTTFLSQGLGLSFLGASLAYHIPGSIGLLLMDASLRQATAQKSQTIRRLATAIVFLPSISFWSAGIGKDSLAFMATCLALWAALELRRRVIPMAAAVLIMLTVRPHMAGLLIVALAASLLVQKKSSLGQRLVLGGAAIAAALVITPIAVKYAGLSPDASSRDVAAYFEQRQRYNLEGGGGVDIAHMNTPMKLYTYLFRPMPFEARSLFALAASVDNVLLLTLFVAGAASSLRRKARHLTGNRSFMWVYSTMGWLILAFSTANLGISMRQKWMIAPMLIYLLISLIGKDRRTAPVMPKGLHLPARPLPGPARYPSLPN